MDSDILRIDLDAKSKKKALLILGDRLKYCNNNCFLSIDAIDKIILNKKTTYGAKIYMNDQYSPEWIIILQLILGSDYRKEVYTCMNHFMYKMEYSNRLFDIKRYSNGEYKKAKHFNVTKEIKEYVTSVKNTCEEK